MTFVRVFVDSFILLKKCPKFFIPKVLISFLFLPLVVLFPMYVIELNLFSVNAVSAMDQTALINTLIQVILLFIYTLAIYVIDYFMINPMYPMLVEQYYKKKKIDFRKAFKEVVHRFGTIFPSVLIFSVFLFAVLGLFAFLILIALLQGTAFFILSVILAIISVTVLFMLFYLIYPISSLEKIDFIKVIKRTIHSSLKHKKEVTKAVIVSYTVTFLSYIIGSVIVLTNTQGQALFVVLLFVPLILTRFLTAVFATYLYVLNAVFYLGIEKGVFLGK
jgi:hypothetical protein